MKIKIGRIKHRFGRVSVEYEFDYGERGWLHFPKVPTEEEILRTLQRVYERNKPTTKTDSRLQAIYKLQNKSLSMKEGRLVLEEDAE